MKKINFIFFFLLVPFVSVCQKSIDSSRFLKIPKTFRMVYYSDTIPKLKEGKKFNGIDTSDFLLNNERMLAVEKYVDGFKIELKTFYDNGNLECHFQWKNGIRDGIDKRLYKNGKVMFDRVMKEGKRVGISYMYYENGNIQCFLDNEKTIIIGFYENQKMSSLAKYMNDSIKCNGKDGLEETEWYENGQLKSKRIHNCGKQLFKEYYNDSTIGREGTQIDMPLFRVGKFTEWYKNGKINLEAYYQDGNTQSEANIKTGTWRYWNEKGKLIKEEYYENNELKKTKTYIPEKKPVGKMEISLTQTPIDR